MMTLPFFIDKECHISNESVIVCKRDLFGPYFSSFGSRDKVTSFRIAL